MGCPLKRPPESRTVSVDLDHQRRIGPQPAIVERADIEFIDPPRGFAGRGAELSMLAAKWLPKKGAAAENDRGKFLVDQKTKKKAAEVDVTWLKDYVEKK